MPSQPFKDFVAQREKERNEATVTFDGQEVLIKDIPDGTVTLAQYNTLRSNQLGFELMIKKYDNEALQHVTKNYLNNCRREDTITYDGALKEFVVPELLNRIKSLSNIVQALHDFGPPSKSTAFDVYAWLESTTSFTPEHREGFSTEKSKVAKVLNDLEVYESDFSTDSPYIIVADNEVTRSKLKAVGVSDAQMDAISDKEYICILALAFAKEPIVNDYLKGKFY